MTELPTYKFDGYTLRPAVAMDALMAMEWTAADPEHGWEAGIPDFWIKSGFGVNCYVLEDAEGVVFFFKMVRINPDVLQEYVCSNCGRKVAVKSSEREPTCCAGFMHYGGDMRNRHEIEVSLQFDRSGTAPLWRAMQGMLVGFGWLEKTLPMNGVDTVYFHSKSPRLIQFAQRRLGFVQDGDRWKRVIGQDVAAANSIKE